MGWKPYKRKYLNKLGVDYSWCKRDWRIMKWKKFYKKYGFDPRETWSLDIATGWFIYERLTQFKKDASKMIDLHFHSFDIPISMDGTTAYCNMSDCIDICLDLVESAIKQADKDYINDDWKADLQLATKIYAVMLPALWW